MKKTLLVAFLCFVLVGSANASDLRSITKITLGQEDPAHSISPETIIYFTFSNGSTEHYTLHEHSSKKPAYMTGDGDTAANRKEWADTLANWSRDDAAVKSWRVGETLNINLSGDCFMSTTITNVSKNPNQTVCFM
jgi:hypothetical protein